MAAENMNREVVLSVKDLKVNFRAYGGLVQAVRGISIDNIKVDFFGILNRTHTKNTTHVYNTYTAKLYIVSD